MAVAGGGSGWIDDRGEGEIRGSINDHLRARGGHMTHSMTTARRGAEAEALPGGRRPCDRGPAGEPSSGRVVPPAPLRPGSAAAPSWNLPGIPGNPEGTKSAWRPPARPLHLPPQTPPPRAPPPGGPPPPGGRPAAGPRSWTGKGPGTISAPGPQGLV